MFEKRDHKNPASFQGVAAGSQAADPGSPSKGAGEHHAPLISLPKGGGAIRGIGEKFTANPVTGTGSLTIPLAVSPGRSGFGPQFSLSYDSGSGNGPFGFGWSLSLAAITRKTDKGLPQYRDEEESDVFILSGAEDLVPVLQPDGSRYEDAISAPGYTVHRYRPRIEGLFARIERWTEQATGDRHWRSISRDNVTTIYGKTFESRIADPRDALHVFTWLICESYDDKGNAVVYRYAAENDQNVDRSQVNERNRERTANRYLKRIQYGNRESRLIQRDLAATDWLFEVVFDYDEDHYEPLAPDPLIPEGEQHHLARAAVAPAESWSTRPDPFSSHRAGFEVRTYRRCRRVLMFHLFDELGSEPYLVRATEFEYADLDYSQPTTVEAELAHQGSTRFGSFISSVIQSGFVRDDNQPLLERHGVTYIKKSLPPLEFEYSKANIQEEIRELDPDSLENLPIGLDGTTYRWVDLDGEGVSGILTEQADACFYKSSMGDGRFGPLKVVASKPSLANLSGGRQELLDLNGNGKLNLVAFAGPSPGFYERTQDENWEPFRAFAHLPNIRWDEPNLRFIDLNGDGRADILITEDEIFSWYPSLAEDGFDSARSVRKPFDEERGPRLVLADATQSICLADMCGDGLTDLVRIRNGEVCYWPNLGYGRFGPKVTMDNAPHFDYPDQFNQNRIRLADIDGSGTIDIVYLGREGVRLFFNQCGNAWSAPRHLAQFPRVDSLSYITTVDLLGNGTACLVWSSPLTGAMWRPMRYIDLMGGQKPHLLTKSVNNLGAETQIHYAASTKFYLADKLAGKPWITKVPFPVHVVERVETHDRISRNRFVTRYAYHHGYFDGIEREFRGFGMVEQWDSEEFAALNDTQAFPAGTNIDETTHVPPILTRTWFHTGVYLGGDRVSNFFAGLLGDDDPGEYFREPGLTDFQARQLLLDDTVLPTGLTVAEEVEACRALKGSMLRQEIYSLAGTTRDQHPYTVSEQNFNLLRLQSKGGNRHAVFFSHAREAINYHYERNPNDPRTTHAVTLKVDEYGTVQRSVTIAYPRANVSDRRPEQNETHLTLTLNRSVNLDHQLAWRHIGLPIETRTYELVKPPAAVLRFGWQELSDLVDALVPSNQHEPPIANTIPYEQWDWRLQWNPSTEPGGLRNTRLRLIEQVRTLYRPDDLGATANDPNALLPLGTVESLALPGESFKLAFIPGLLGAVYGGRVSDSMLDEAGYVHSDGDANWWLPTGRAFFSFDPLDTPAQELTNARQHFFLLRRYRDPFGHETNVTYDNHDLLVVDTSDPLGNRITAGERDATGDLISQGNDYRVLQPALTMDANRNRAAVAFDAMGMVVGTAVMGEPLAAPVEGDSLEGFDADLTEAVMHDHLAHPLTAPQSILRRATTRLVYDLFAYYRSKDEPEPRPSVVYTLVRETHDSDPVPADGLKIQHSFSYSDGFGREIQKKIQAEPGPVPNRDALGRIIVGTNAQALMTTSDVSPRWVGSGWTVFNNKGKPVRQSEPFFTDSHCFEFDVRIGVSSVLFYDPVGRVVASLHPNHTWEKVVFDPWRQQTWDVNDTVLVADPSADLDVGDFFSPLQVADYLPTWYAQRTGLNVDPQEQTVAHKSAIHAGTPTVAHFDSLGRTFLTVAQNKFKYSDTPPTDPPVEEPYETRVLLDIEGNQREVIDASDRVVMKYDYGIAGPDEDKNKDGANNRIHQASMEAGERWVLNDVTGKPLYAWDSRNHQFRTGYDPLRRPTESFMREGASAELLVGRTVYGETLGNPEAKNMRAKVYQLFDQAGVVTSDEYDFKGNALSSQRQLAAEYKTTLDWSGAVTLEAPAYTSSTDYDALNRPTELTAPDNSRIRPGYNEANLLERIDANLRGAEQNGEPVWTPFVTDIDYDAKGQRMLIDYGNGARTTYAYDPLTFRLIHLLTQRQAADFPDDCPAPPPEGWPGCRVQNLHYTYDPAGNITHIRDEAQQTVYFRNQRVEPNAEYTYDSIYRLIEATGREHLGQAGNAPAPGSYDDKPRVGILLSASDGNAMGRYLQRYVYDAVGNFERMIHRGSNPVNPGWTRDYAYNEASLIEPGKQSNRLSSTTIGTTAETYSAGGDGYDAHGNMLRMPHLQIMQWDFRDQLQMTQRQAVNPSDEDGVERQGERTWYVYDTGGQRVRKVTELSSGQIKDERIYLGGFEVYRRQGMNPLVRETLHIMDDKKRIALIETRTEGSDPSPQQLVRYQFDNHLGSASLELDDKAQIISYEEYTPYGSTSFQAVRNQTETPKRYRYTGQERDEESGLYYHGARYYVPWLGRWASSDPSGLTDGANLYSYVNSNPTVKIDSSGREGIFPGDNPNKRLNAAVSTATAKPRIQEFGPQYLSINVGGTKTTVYNFQRLTYSDFAKTLPKPKLQETVVGPDDLAWNDSHLSDGAQAGRNTRLALNAYKGDSFWMKLSIVAYNLGAPAINTVGGAVVGAGPVIQKYRADKAANSAANNTNKKAPTELVGGKYFEKKSAWGGAIGKQGKANEDQILKQDPDLIALPINFKTFDIYNWTTETAISAKTIDMNTASKILKPSQLFTTLQKYIDAAANFKTYTLKGQQLSEEIIRTRELNVALPSNVHFSNAPYLPALMQKTIEYGKAQGVNVIFSNLE